jgi:hypothetical protein
MLLGGPYPLVPKKFFCEFFDNFWWKGAPGGETESSETIFNINKV